MMFRFFTNLAASVQYSNIYRTGFIYKHRFSVYDQSTSSITLLVKRNTLRQTPWRLSVCHKSSSNKNPYPPLNEDELEEKFVQGSGPGGQNVNKLSNCVMLTHLPTGEVIKCHEHRLLAKNRITARLRMQERLDWFYNRENSIKEQQKKEDSKRRQLKKNRTNERLAKLKAFKEREGID